MAENRVCICGKCDLKCYKHNKKATCQYCKKVRMLGTVIRHGVRRYVCGECCNNVKKEIEERDRKQLEDYAREQLENYDMELDND